MTSFIFMGLMEQCQQNSTESKRDVLLEVGQGTKTTMLRRFSSRMRHFSRLKLRRKLYHPFSMKSSRRDLNDVNEIYLIICLLKGLVVALTALGRENSFLELYARCHKKQSHMSDSIKYSILFITHILDLCLQYFGILWRILRSDRQERCRK